ncbi:hypothetical protein IAR55_006920 [Kwoniella newhampshirensis]|uniref:Cytoplasmic protein n=1 Tax=Kwoniella newhampshirensis TaxID=1651941 RepID=A0AAW0YT17_9TREE
MLKDIVERPSQAPSSSSSLPNPPQPPAPGSTGFPVAQHRSARPSAFARARKQQQARQDGQRALGEGRAVDVVPTLQVTKSESRPTRVVRSEVDEVRDAVDKENKARVEEMTEEEREQEVEELKERFGQGIVGLMRKRKEARERKSFTAESNSIASGSSTPRIPIPLEEHMGDAQKVLQQVSEENERKVQAMGGQEREHEIQELEERFGPKVMEALRRRAQVKAAKGKDRESSQIREEVPPPPTVDQNSSPGVRSPEEPPLPEVEQSRRELPTTASDTSKLQWIQTLAKASHDTSTRFDLSGIVLSESAKSNLPTHLGLHHHGSSPDLAGYTLEDILYLCRSTVSSQRITMMGVLAKIVSRLSDQPNAAKYTDEVVKECGDLGVIQQAIELGVEVLAGLARGVGVIHAGVNLLYHALQGPSWSWMNDDNAVTCAFVPDSHNPSPERPAGLASIPFEDVLPRLIELLSIEDGLSPDTTQQLILILRRATFKSQQVCETICPIVPIISRQHVVQRPWPLKDVRRPSVDAIRLLRDITASSRACAEDLLSQGVYETTLKFVITATWSEDEVDVDTLRHGQALALVVLQTYQILGRYGLSSSVITSSSEVWRRLGAWVQDRCSSTNVSEAEQCLVEAYFQILSIWTTCAIDPHRTTPEHDITWAQVSALSWTDEAISAVQALSTQAQRSREIASALGLLVAWSKGAQVNGVRSGEEEKTAVLSGLESFDLNSLTGSEREPEMRIHGALVQLHALLSPIGELLNAHLIAQIRQSLDDDSEVDTTRSAIYLRYHLLLIDTSTEAKSNPQWLSNAMTILESFQIGDEPLALDLVDHILKADWTSTSFGTVPSLSHPDGLQVIRPLLQYTILPDVENVIAPHEPSHLYLKATKTLRPPAPPSDDEKPAIVGLPLQTDWIFSPLNELLRSGTSLALSQVPPDWTASETEIVQATLALAQLVYVKAEGLDRSRILFNLMKVFMLEHGQQSAISTSEAEVFRDPVVAQSMSKLMSKLVTHSSSSLASAACLETVSLPFLGAGIPFFQFYTDFIALYEAISFSDTLFAQCLIPPLAMSYPADYRKLLWNDHSTALRGMRLSLDQIPVETAGIESYFQPLETNTEILNGYARAITRGWVTEQNHGFLSKVAVHHLAGLFWRSQADAAAEEEEEEKEESTRVGLMVMILANGSDGLIKRILEWDLNSIDRIQVDGEEKTRRKEFVRKLTGERGKKRVENI